MLIRGHVHYEVDKQENYYDLADKLFEPANDVSFISHDEFELCSNTCNILIED